MKFALNPIALRTAKTLWSFGHSECNRVKGMNLLLEEVLYGLTPTVKQGRIADLLPLPVYSLPLILFIGGIWQ